MLQRISINFCNVFLRNNDRRIVDQSLLRERRRRHCLNIADAVAQLLQAARQRDGLHQAHDSRVQRVARLLRRRVARLQCIAGVEQARALQMTLAIGTRRQTKHGRRRHAHAEAMRH